MDLAFGFVIAGQQAYSAIVKCNFKTTIGVINL